MKFCFFALLWERRNGVREERIKGQEKEMKEQKGAGKERRIEEERKDAYNYFNSVVEEWKDKSEVFSDSSIDSVSCEDNKT